MPLEVQGPRQLSPLEDEVITFVFEQRPPPGVKRTIIVQDILLKIVENTPFAVSTYRNGLITISKSALPHTQALNQNSTREHVYPSDGTFQRTDPFSPWEYALSIYADTWVRAPLAREVQSEQDPGHDWDPPYDFSREELRNLDLSSEQHASAAQIYFLIAWQLRYRPSPGFEEKYLDLTSQSLDRSKNVGPVDRYTWIFDRFKHTDDGKRHLDRTDARGLYSHFNNYERNLWNRGETTPCKESTQVARNLEGRFYEPIVVVTGSGSRPCKEEHGLV